MAHSPKVYRLADAIALVGQYGMTRLCVRDDVLARNPLVSIKQNWWPKGTEVANFRFARGKYRGNCAGFATNPNSPR